MSWGKVVEVPPPGQQHMWATGECIGITILQIQTSRAGCFHITCGQPT